MTPRAREMRSFLMRLDRGESTLDELADEAGVRPSTLTWWRSRLRRDGLLGQETAVSFVELSVEADEHAPLVVEVGEARVVVPDGFDEEELVRLVAALRRC